MSSMAHDRWHLSSEGAHASRVRITQRMQHMNMLSQAMDSPEQMYRQLINVWLQALKLDHVPPQSIEVRSPTSLPPDQRP